MIFNMVGGGGASKLPAFTYTGDYMLIDDGKEGSVQNWRIKFLTSGTLTFTKTPGTIDVFAVGGGGGGGNDSGGGGGGGYTKTQAGVVAYANTPYEIVVGAGGAKAASVSVLGSTGGQTSAFGVTANGGGGGGSEGSSYKRYGGNGGSGGGSGGADSRTGSYGGSDGSNGLTGNATGGTGQGTTTREFGESSGELYAGGGGGGGGVTTANNYGGAGGGGNGGSYINGGLSAGQPNTGGGGGGGAGFYGIGADGGSGIVVIRNHREVSA